MSGLQLLVEPCLRKSLNLLPRPEKWNALGPVPTACLLFLSAYYQAWSQQVSLAYLPPAMSLCLPLSTFFSLAPSASLSLFLSPASPFPPFFLQLFIFIMYLKDRVIETEGKSEFFHLAGRLQSWEVNNIQDWSRSKPGAKNSGSPLWMAGDPVSELSFAAPSLCLGLAWLLQHLGVNQWMEELS